MRKNTFIIIGILVLVIVAISLSKPKPSAVTQKIALEKKDLIERGIVKKSEFKSAPEFMLKDINGAERKLSDFKDKVVILDFWATWCPPCRQEIPHFVELYSEYKDQGLEVIGVSLDWNGQKVLPEFISQNGINYTVLLGNEEVSDLFGGIQAIPTTFILDREGKIRKKYIGYNGKEIFEKDIKEIL